MTLRKSAAALTIAGALAGGMSACASPPDASELTSPAKKTATAAKTASVAIVGTVNGTKTTFDASGTLDGKNQKQTQAQGKASSEGYIVGNMAYLKANETFWKQIGAPEKDAKNLQGKWWSGTSKGSSSSPALDMKKLVNDFFSSSDGKKLASNDAEVKESTTDGRETYTVNDPKNKDGARLVVTRDDDAQLVKIENYSSELTKTKATYTFSKWNEVETYKAPAGAKSLTEALARSSGKSPEESKPNKPSGSSSSGSSASPSASPSSK